MSQEQPLAGRRVVVTRAQEAASRLTARLRALGATVDEAPLLRFEPPESYAPLDEALEHLAMYDMLLVTSAKTVRILLERKPAPWPDQPWTAAIGPGTAASLQDAGLRLDMVPKEAVGESLLDALHERVRGLRILLPRAAVARDILPDGLRAAGAQVDVAAAYRTMPERSSREVLSALFAAEGPHVDAVTFTSGSTVDYFFLLLGEQQARRALGCALACSIGPITTERLRSYAVEQVAEALPRSLEGLAQLLVEQCGRRVKES